MTHIFCKLGLDTQLAIGMGHGGQSPASNLEEDEEYDYDYDYNMVRRRKTGIWSNFETAPLTERWEYKL